MLYVGVSCSLCESRQRRFLGKSANVGRKTLPAVDSADPFRLSNGRKCRSKATEYVDETKKRKSDTPPFSSDFGKKQTASRLPRQRVVFETISPFTFVRTNSCFARTSYVKCPRYVRRPSSCLRSTVFPPPRQNWSVTAATTCRQRAHKSRRTGRRFGAEYSVDLLIGRPSVNSLVCTTNTSYPSPGNRRDVIGRKRIYMATTQYEDVYYTK